MDQLFLAAACGPTFFMIVVLVLGFVTPSYNAARQTISELVLGRFGVGQTLNFAISGALIITLGGLLLGRDAEIVPSIGVCFMGGILLLSAFFRTDPVEVSIDKPTTTTGAVHVALFMIGILSVDLVQILFGMMTFGTVHSVYSLISAAVILICLTLTLSRPGHRGIYQRILVATIMLWITIFSVTHRG